jgi:hypothetical protein
MRDHDTWTGIIDRAMRSCIQGQKNASGSYRYRTEIPHILTAYAQGQITRFVAWRDLVELKISDTVASKALDEVSALWKSLTEPPKAEAQESEVEDLKAKLTNVEATLLKVGFERDNARSRLIDVRRRLENMRRDINYLVEAINISLPEEPK